MPLPRVLVTGATGLLGPFVVQALAGRAAVTTSARRGGDVPVDLAEPGAPERLLGSTGPDLVLHLAALSRLDACARDPELATLLNAAVPAVLAQRLGPRFCFVSTDLVFDGRRAPYRAGDAPSPLSHYGASKAAGEEAVLANGGRVVRLPLLFADDAQGRGATAMVRAAIAAGRPLQLYTNEYRTPLHCADAARGVADVLFATGGARCVHLPGPERVSRWELGQRLCRVHALPRDLLAAVECQDHERPRDVSLAGDWQPSRDLAAMLQDS